MTPASGRAAIARQIEKHGTPVKLLRDGLPPFPIKVRYRSFTERELASGSYQGMRAMIIPIEPLEAAGWPVPVQDGDQIDDNGEISTIGPVDANTRSIAGVLIAYDVMVTG